MTFVFTAPYAPVAIDTANNEAANSSCPHPGFDAVRVLVCRHDGRLGAYMIITPIPTTATPHHTHPTHKRTQAHARAFFDAHGVAVKAIGIEARLYSLCVVVCACMNSHETCSSIYARTPLGV